MNVKVRAFNGANIEDMYSYVKPLLKKEPSYVLLHVGTNDAPFLTSEHILNEILLLKLYIEKIGGKCESHYITPNNSY